MSFDGVALTLLAVLVGIFVGLARGGRFRNVVGITVRAKGLLVIGIVVPALADQFTRAVAVPLVVGGLAALLAFAIVNVRIVGMSVMAVGIVANLLPTFLNGGLPVSRDALVEAGLATRAEVDRVELRGARRLEEPTHRLRFLGDIIPLEATNQVLAFGDLVILVGLADITANLTLRKRRRSSTEADDERERDVAVIDLVRLHVSHGPRDPRPHPSVALEAEPEGAAVATHAPDATVAASPDVVWWPVAPRTTPVVADLDVVDLETVDLDAVDLEPADLDVAADRGAGEGAEATDDDAPHLLAGVAPELVEDEPLVDWEELEAEGASTHGEAAVHRDEVDEVEMWADVDPDLLADPDLLTEAEAETEPRRHADLAPADLVHDEPAEARRRRFDLDLDLRWAPEPEPAAEADIDLRDLPEPGVDGAAVEVAPRWATAEPEWAPEAEPERPEDAARSSESGRRDTEAPALVATAVITGDDDDLFQLLFADLKPRRSRRRGERTIPDFEPVHVDDDAINPRRR